MTTYVLFHAACPDGYTAAWAAWRKLGDDAHYIPVQHGQPPPEMAAGSKVYILDFSYPRQTILEMQAGHGISNIAVLDHHKTAESELKGLAGPIVFNLNRSGAAIAWQHFHPADAPPPLVRYVEDRDLWRWRLPQSKEISAYIKAVGFGDVGEFERWNDLNLRLKHERESVAAAGSVVLSSHDQLVALQAGNARRGTLDGHNCIIVNTAALASETADFLLTQHPDAQIAMIWFELESGESKVSLRSRPAGPDVSAIAKARGGGGHPNAAGYISPHRPRMSG